MNVNQKKTPSNWVDPDDAPELTDEELARSVWRIDGKIVSEKEGRAAFAKRLQPKDPANPQDN